MPAALEAGPTSRCSTSRCPAISGLDAAAELRARLPGCRVLILTTFGRPGYLRRAMEAGAAGFLVKDGPVEELAARDPPGAGRREGRSTRRWPPPR